MPCTHKHIIQSFTDNQYSIGRMEVEVYCSEWRWTNLFIIAYQSGIGNKIHPLS